MKAGPMDVRTSPEHEIEDAKLTLDGARSIYQHAPTAENARVVKGCEDTMNYLLDRYPRSGDRSLLS